MVRHFLSLIALVAGALCIPGTGVAAIITIDETKQLWAASAPVLGGYVVLCEAIPPQQGACATSAFSDIVVFNDAGTPNISYFSDDDKNCLVGFGDCDPADVGFGAFGPGGLATVAADPRTVFFDETLSFTDPTTGVALPIGTVVYTPAAAGPGFPVAGGAPDTFIIRSDCSDCACSVCSVPEPSTFSLFGIGTLLALRAAFRKSLRFCIH